MATLMELINFFDHDSKEYENFLQDLICFNGDVPFEEEQVERAHNIIISTVNNHLNRSHSRYNGLLLLDKVLSQCSKDILSKYCLLWMSKATQVLENIHSAPQELSISCKVLGSLIIQSKDIPDVHKQVSMQNVKQLVNIINNLSPEKKCGAIYYLIAVLLHQYPEVCERFQISFRKIILSQIDSTEENLVNASAKCYAFLAKATERSFKPPAAKPNYTCWTYNQALICNNLHVIMDELFSSLIELENVSISDKLELPDISEENVIKFYLNQKQRFVNLCSYLACMLRGFGKKNSVFPHEILKVLCRGLAIQPLNLKNQNTVREHILYLILPKLHSALFNVLDALINGFKKQLVPFGSVILQLFTQALQWTENVLENQITISGSKPFRNVRICVYKCLNSWLTNTNTLSGIETVADECLSSILKDIVPEKDRVLLTIQKTQNLSKRALKRLRDSQYEKGTYLSNGIASSKEHYLDEDVCKVALDVLQNIFFDSGTLLKQTFFKTTQNIIIPLLYDSYLSSTEQKFYKEHSACRLLLFRVLRALQINPHSLVPLPTQYSIEIFEMALNDNDLHVVQEAKVALAELEKIAHPHAPSIQLIQVETLQKEFITNDQIMQKSITEITENTSLNNIETVTSEDIEPSLNKRLKVADAQFSNEIETNAKNGQANQNPLEETSIIEERATIAVQNKNIDEQFTEEVSNKSADKINEIDSIAIITDAETTEIVREPEGSCTEVMDTIEETSCNMENVAKKSEAEEKDSSLEKEKEKEEHDILQLFQDIPKTSDKS